MEPAYSDRPDLLSDVAQQISIDELSGASGQRRVIRYVQALRNELALGSDLAARAPMRLFREMDYNLQEIQLEMNESDSDQSGGVFNLVRSPGLDRLLTQLDAFIELLNEEVP